MEQHKLICFIYIMICLCDLTLGFNSISSVEYFRKKNMKFITGFLCNDSGTEEFAKQLSEAGMRSNFPSLEEIEITKTLGRALYYPSAGMTGIVIDMSCEHSQTVLDIASENRFFDITRHWLIFMNDYFTLPDFEKSAQQEEPEMFDPFEYLAEGNTAMAYGTRMQEINIEANADILTDPEIIAMVAAKKNGTKLKHNSGLLASYVNLKAIVDSEVVLAVKEQRGGFTLYRIHRKTIFTKMLIENIGTMWEETGHGNLQITVPFNVSSVNSRKDFNGTLIRAVVALLHRGYYGKSDELTTESFDYWAMKNTQISILTQEHYNFRMLVKCFDQYGWMQEDGTYTGMLQHLYEKKTDMTAGGMLLIESRMGAIDYVTNNCLVRVALLFKQPALSQVTNIFVLPFSRGVWISISVLIIVAGVVLYFQIRVTKKISDESTARIKFPEIFTFLTGAACQQGFDITTNMLSARMTMLVFLASVLFLFTSYNANIVSLLQASSNSIHDIRTFIDSSLGMAVENLDYEVKLIEVDNDPLIRELYQKKLAPKLSSGTAYLDTEVGMKLVRNNLFAFHLELETAGRIIGETYSESEKCRMKTITLFPTRYNGHVVTKKSPYWEILAQAYRWYTEVGFTERGLNRFSYSLPKCTNSGGGFNSIGFSDVDYVVIFFAFGIGMSVLCLAFEKIYHFRGRRRQFHVQEAKIKSDLMIQHNMQFYVN